MLQPKKPKFRKQFKGRMHGVSKGGNFLNFGAFGLKALTPARIDVAKEKKLTIGAWATHHLNNR